MPSKEGRKFSEASTEPSVVIPEGALEKVPRNVVTREESAATLMVGTRVGVKTVVAARALRTPERVTEPSGVMATCKTAVTSEESAAAAVALPDTGALQWIPKDAGAAGALRAAGAPAEVTAAPTPMTWASVVACREQKPASTEPHVGPRDVPPAPGSGGPGVRGSTSGTIPYAPRPTHTSCTSVPRFGARLPKPRGTPAHALTHPTLSPPSFRPFSVVQHPAPLLFGP